MKSHLSNMPIPVPAADLFRVVYTPMVMLTTVVLSLLLGFSLATLTTNRRNSRGRYYTIVLGVAGAAFLFFWQTEFRFVVALLAPLVEDLFA